MFRSFTCLRDRCATLRFICLLALIATLAAPAIGDLLVSSLDTGQILRFDFATGEASLFAEHPSLDQPRGITLGPDGKLYVNDQGGQVHRFDGRTGNYLDTPLNLGDGGNRLEGIAFVGNTLIVGYHFNGRLLSYDLNGSTLTLDHDTATFNSTDDPNLQRPLGLTTDPTANRLLVAQLDPDTTDPNTNQDTYRVVELDPDTLTRVSSFDVPSRVGQVALAPDGSIFATGTDTTRIYKSDADGDVNLTLPEVTGKPMNPLGIVADRASNIFVASQSDDRVLLMDGSDGSILRTFTVNTAELTLDLPAYLTLLAPEAAAILTDTTDGLGGSVGSLDLGQSNGPQSLDGLSTSYASVDLAGLDRLNGSDITFLLDINIQGISTAQEIANQLIAAGVNASVDTSDRIRIVADDPGQDQAHFGWDIADFTDTTVTRITVIPEPTVTVTLLLLSAGLLCHRRKNSTRL
jgi:streptogramin lyase